jgi:hypothetical protein
LAEGQRFEDYGHGDANLNGSADALKRLKFGLPG